MMKFAGFCSREGIIFPELGTFPELRTFPGEMQFDACILLTLRMDTENDKSSVP